MPRWTHILFGLVWLAGAAVFGRLAYDAHKSENTNLTRFDFRIPREFQVQIGPVRFQDVINGLADAHDKNVSALEASIRESAHTSFWLNCISSSASLCGFFAQVGEYFHERCSKYYPTRKKNGNQDEAIAAKDTSQPVESQTQTANGKTA